jgi:hypothetical protein
LPFHSTSIRKLVIKRSLIKKKTKKQKKPSGDGINFNPNSKRKLYCFSSFLGMEVDMWVGGVGTALSCYIGDPTLFQVFLKHH